MDYFFRFIWIPIHVLWLYGQYKYFTLSVWKSTWDLNIFISLFLVHIIYRSMALILLLSDELHLVKYLGRDTFVCLTKIPYGNRHCSVYLCNIYLWILWTSRYSYLFHSNVTSLLHKRYQLYYSILVNNLLKHSYDDIVSYSALEKENDMR